MEQGIGDLHSTFITDAEAQGSISAWLIKRLGRKPKPNEVFRTAGAEFTIRRIRRDCVFEVSVSPARTRALARSL